VCAHPALVYERCTQPGSDVAAAARLFTSDVFSAAEFDPTLSGAAAFEPSL